MSDKMQRERESIQYYLQSICVWDGVTKRPETHPARSNSISFDKGSIMSLFVREFMYDS